MTDTIYMWEVRAADGYLTDLLAWVSAQTVESDRIYVSSTADGESDSDRVVVIAANVDALAAAPAELLARPPHAWPFRQIRGD